MRKLPSTPVLERLCSRLVRPDGEGGCWIFSGAKNSGYGYISTRNGKQALTHVVMFESVNGPVAAGSDVHHMCNTRACCNPKHLKLLTHAEHAAMHWAEKPRRTHCTKGHALVEGNVYFNEARGERPACRTCALERGARVTASRKALRVPRALCNRGLHTWIPENLMKDRRGNCVKRCRLCFNARQQAMRLRKRAA